MTAPTLLIVGGEDVAVLEMNRKALAALRAPSRLSIVEGAGHLFEESGTLAEAAILATDWFTRYLLAEGEQVEGAAPDDIAAGSGTPR